MSQETRNAALAAVFAKPERQVWRGVCPAPGQGATRVVAATYNPSANTGERTIAAHGLNVRIPKGAVLTRAWYDVITTFTSDGADAGTIALHVESANDIVTAIAINNGGNPWDAGIHAVTLTMVKTTEERELTATVAANALTAGKMVVYVEYIQSALA